MEKEEKPSKGKNHSKKDALKMSPKTFLLSHKYECLKWRIIMTKFSNH